MKNRSRALAAALGTCALVAALPGAASAEPTISELRVESGSRPLDSGTNYVNDTARLQTAPSQCGGSGAVKTVAGPSAIGIVEHAKRANDLLRPYFVSDRFDFGLIVCRIGNAGAFDANEAWLYKVDHRSAQVGGDQFRLARRDQVLWYFANFATGQNTGDELELRTPARARRGVPFTITAVAYNADGQARPAPGATISGDATAITGPDGRARVTVPEEGTASLRTKRGNDIPAAPSRVCVNDELSRCPAERPERIVGRNGRDSIVGFPSPDLVDARGGDDRVDVRSGDADIVRCGGGRDSVLSGRNDRVAGDCERVNGVLRR